jgi:hypothetical protein
MIAVSKKWLAALLIFIALPLGALFFLKLQRAWEILNLSGWKLGEMSAIDHSPERCRTLFAMDRAERISASEKTIDCFSFYARRTGDVESCTSLLFDEHVLFCIDSAINESAKKYSKDASFDSSECVHPQAIPFRQDWCHYTQAHRSHNPSDCAPINDVVLREGCTLKFDLWQRYPSLRQSRYFGNSTSSSSQTSIGKKPPP